MTHAPATPLPLKFPPPVWLAGMLLLAYGLRVFDVMAAVFIRFVPLGIMFGVAGIAIGVWAVLIFAVAGTEIEPASATNKMLITRSPFSFTRNPMYLGLILIAIGFALYFGSWPFYVVPVALFFLVDRVFVPFEEAKMAAQFGDRYTEYRARIRRWL